MTHIKRIDEMFNHESDDRFFVNKKNDGNKLWKISIWSGSGYSVSEYYVYANDDTLAIDTVLSWLKKNEPEMTITDEYFKDIKKYRKRGMKYEDFERELDDFYITNSDGDIAVYHENFKIEEIK